MKKFTTAFFLLALLTACSKHFIQVFDTETTNTQLKDGKYVYENDTIKITYSFWQSKGVMSFSIYNKSNKPIYIDWKNSSFIYNDHKLNYWVEESPPQLSGNFYGYYYDGPLKDLHTTMNEGVQNYSSSVITYERVTFIPPKSGYDRSQFYLLPIDHCELNIDCPSSEVPRNDNPKKQTTIYSRNFSYLDSPLRFRNYLAYSFSENSQKFFFIDNGFYLSSVKEMDIRHYRGKQTGGDSENGTVYENPYAKKTSFYINLESYYYSVEMRKY